MNFRLPRPSDADRLFRRWRLERALTRHLPRTGGMTRVAVTGPGLDDMDHRLRLAKDGRRMIVQFDHRRILPDDWYFFVYPRRTAVLIDLFGRTDPGVTEVFAEISDGYDSGDGWITFCSQYPKAILVPDHDFYNAAGYADIRGLAGSGPGWAERAGGFCWRGSTTGRGTISTPEMAPGDQRLTQRTRLCLLSRNRADVDVKFTRIVQSKDEPVDRGRLEGAGVMGPSIPNETWRGRKFAFDIDGNTNAWSNLFTRLLMGCCVIKVGSGAGFRQWYYADLRPFEHYVPVAADFSDLDQRLEWCREHDRECATIAAAGQEFALQRTLEREMAAGVERINQGFGTGVTAAADPRANAM